MSENDNGHIFQDGLRIYEKSKQPGIDSQNINFPIRATVLRVYAIDDAQNGPGETVLCDLQAQDHGLFLYKVPYVTDMSTVDNYIYKTLRAASINVHKEKFNSQMIDPRVSDGDTVLVQFINGSIREPVITFVYPHPQTGFKDRKIDGKKIVAVDPKPTKADGEVYKVRMNGMNFLFDKDGNVSYKTTNTFDEKIPKKKKFYIELNAKKKDGSPENQKCEVEVDDTGTGKICLKVTKANGKLQEFCIDAGTNTVTTKITTDDDKINEIKISPTGVDLTVGKGNLTETVTDGDRIVSTKNQTFNIDGDLTINAKKMTFNASDDFKVEGAANIDIKAATEASFWGTAGTTLGNASSITNVNGSLVNLAGGGVGVARLGDMAVGTGNLGAPVISNIAQGSPKVSCG